MTDGGRLTLSNLVLDNHSIAILTDADTGKVYGTDLLLSYNGIGMQGRKIRVTNLTASANFTVAQARKTTIEDSTVVASGGNAPGQPKLSVRTRTGYLAAPVPAKTGSALR